MRTAPGASSLPAYAAYARALFTLFVEEDPGRVAEAFEMADRRAADWVMVRRDVVLAAVSAMIERTLAFAPQLALLTADMMRF